MIILSATTAMPGASFSLPARRTCPGALRLPGTVCAACYADRRGRYRWQIVRDAQAQRLAWTLEALRSGRFAPVLIEHIALLREPYFRVHDAGDFFSTVYVAAWVEVARALPQVRFWAPTHSWALRGLARPDSDPLLAALRHLAALPNVTVRPSAILLGEPPPQVPGLAAGSAVTERLSDATCQKATRTPPSCGPCRRCWDEPLSPVTYLRH